MYLHIADTHQNWLTKYTMRMQVSFGRNRLSHVRLRYTDTAWRSTEQLGEGSLHPPERMTSFDTKELSFNFSNTKQFLLGKQPAADLLANGV